MLDAKREHAEAQQGTSDWAIFVRNFHLGAGGTLEEYIGTPFGSPGFEETLRTSITGTWTAIETLLGDLWEAALNCHPETLASLKGRSNKIGKPPKQTVQVHQSGREYDAESKHVSLDLIGMHRFDLRNCMGTVFRMQGRVNFTHLSSIREAYSQAFSAKCGSIDSALSGPSLDCIGTVRNLIVHKAGVVDDEYLKRSSYLKIPKANIDKPLSLDGEIVADLIRNAISSANSLSVAVDNWIAQN